MFIAFSRCGLLDAPPVTFFACGVEKETPVDKCVISVSISRYSNSADRLLSTPHDDDQPISSVN